jgi:Aldo/keto reductase family
MTSSEVGLVETTRQVGFSRHGVQHWRGLLPSHHCQRPSGLGGNRNPRIPAVTHGLRRSPPSRLLSASLVVGRTPAQVLLRWCVQRDLVVVMKSAHRDRLEESAPIFDFTVSNEDMAALDALDERAAPSARSSAGGGNAPRTGAG